MATAADVMNLTRVFLNDTVPDYWTNTVLVEPVKSAYRRVAREFENHAIRIGKKTQTISSFTAGLTALDRTTTPALNSDFLQPMKIWEKDVGAQDYQYTEVVMVQELPDRTANTMLLEYTWKTGQIQFVAATTARALRIDYRRGFTDIVDSTTSLAFDDVVDVTAHYTAAMCFAARGSLEEAAGQDAMGEHLMKKLLSFAAKTQQRIPYRRLPFNGR